MDIVILVSFSNGLLNLLTFKFHHQLRDCRLLTPCRGLWEPFGRGIAGMASLFWRLRLSTGVTGSTTNFEGEWIGGLVEEECVKPAQERNRSIMGKCVKEGSEWPSGWNRPATWGISPYLHPGSARSGLWTEKPNMNWPSRHYLTDKYCCIIRKELLYHM